MCIFANIVTRPISTRISDHSRRVPLRNRNKVNSKNLISINPIESIVHQCSEKQTKNSDFRKSTLVNVPRQTSTSGLSQFSSKFALLNARSIRSKTDRIKDEVFFENIDILGLTETWLTESSIFEVREITPPGYDFVHVDRTAKHGGGVGLICRKQYNPRLLPHKPFSTFEHCHVELNCDSKQVHIIIIFRPPSSALGQFLVKLRTF